MQHDIIVVGSGIVGATAALALATHSNLKIALIEAKPPSLAWSEKSLDHRVSAISLASQRIFSHLQIWDSICAKRISPYTHMHVWDSQGKGNIHFDCKNINVNALGYIIEDNVIRSSLLEKIQQCDRIHVHHGWQLESLQKKSTHVELHAKNQPILTAKLVIAADGAHSWTRDQVKIALTTKAYQHTAIVTTVQTELPHQKMARQCFLPTGPLAFLPLMDAHRCSIVWSVTPDYAKNLLALEKTEFLTMLSKTFNALGEVIDVEPRHAFELHMRHAKQYVQERIALVGDAAHTLHPLAGQGVNLGLLDVAALVEVIQNAQIKNRDFSSLINLRRYERWRKSNNLLMLTMVEMLKNLFASEKKSLKTLRNAGMQLTDQMQIIKNFLMRYALGQHHDSPRLAR